MGTRNKRVVVVSPISSPSEALELLRVALKTRTGVVERTQSLRAVRKWLEKRENEIADIEHGAAHLMLQLAQETGERRRTAPSVIQKGRKAA